MSFFLYILVIEILNSFIRELWKNAGICHGVSGAGHLGHSLRLHVSYELTVCWSVLTITPSVSVHRLYWWEASSLDEAYGLLSVWWIVSHCWMSRKLSNQLQPAEAVGWNQNGSVTASEPIGSSQMANGDIYRGLTLGRHPTWKNSGRLSYYYLLPVLSLTPCMLEFIMLLTCSPPWLHSILGFCCITLVAKRWLSHIFPI